MAEGGRGDRGDELTTEECIRAGMHFFGRSEFESAEAWWRRALSIDPDNIRARQCLRLLESTTNIGFAGELLSPGRAEPEDPFAGSLTPGAEAASTGVEDEDLELDISVSEDVDIATASELELNIESPAALPPEPPQDDRAAPDFGEGTHSGVWKPPPPEVMPMGLFGSAEGTPAPRESEAVPPAAPPPDEVAGGTPSQDLKFTGSAGVWRKPAPEVIPEAVTRQTGPLDPLEARPRMPPEPPTMPPPPPTPSLDIEWEDDEAPPEPKRRGPPPPPPPSMDIPADGTDPLDFATTGSHMGPAFDVSAGADKAPSPWDEGPARTSVVTLEHLDEFDALAEHTPMPEGAADFVLGNNQGSAIFAAAADVHSPTIPDGGLRIPSDDIDIDVAVEMGAQEAPAFREPATTDEILAVARDRFQLHDFAGAIELLERVDFDDPNFDASRALLKDARRNLLKMFESKIGDLSHRPQRLISGEEIIWLNLNHRAGFILAQIDGQVSYEDLLSLSGMSRIDTVRVLAELLEQRVIG